jgi:hypothetical protein
LLASTPHPWSKCWLPNDDLPRYLTVLWQVDGAALGLSLAVLVFAFQAYAQSPYGGSLSEFASDTAAMWIVFIGLTSLFVDGLALLGVGRGGSEGWAGASELLRRGTRATPLVAVTGRPRGTRPARLW